MKITKLGFGAETILMEWAHLVAHNTRTSIEDAIQNLTSITPTNNMWVDAGRRMIAAKKSWFYPHLEIGDDGRPTGRSTHE